MMTQENSRHWASDLYSYRLCSLILFVKIASSLSPGAQKSQKCLQSPRLQLLGVSQPPLSIWRRRRRHLGEFNFNQMEI